MQTISDGLLLLQGIFKLYRHKLRRTQVFGLYLPLPIPIPLPSAAVTCRELINYQSKYARVCKCAQFCIFASTPKLHA